MSEDMVEKQVGGGTDSKLHNLAKSCVCLPALFLPCCWGMICKLSLLLGLVVVVMMVM